MSTRPHAATTRQELDATTAEFDREFVIDDFGKPLPTARATWRRARRKPGRPAIGQGVKVISVSLEKGLLKEADHLAKSEGVSRAKLIARGLRAVLAAEHERRPVRPRRSTG